jgi:hypothetical protein
MMAFTTPTSIQAMNHHCFQRKPRYVWMTAASAFNAMKEMLAASDGR